jgi:hypothetical protein
MYTSPWLFSYILSVIVAALLTTGIFNSPLGLVFADQLPRHSPQAIAEPDFSKVAAITNVERSRKGDRLPVTRADPVTNTTIILKNVGVQEHTVRGTSGTPVRPMILRIEELKLAPKQAPAPLLDCEALASPISDPILSRFIGRCFV